MAEKLRQSFFVELIDFRAGCFFVKCKRFTNTAYRKMPKMSRHEEIPNAYKSIGGEAAFFDGTITCSTLPGRAVCKRMWNMARRKPGFWHPDGFP